MSLDKKKVLITGSSGMVGKNLIEHEKAKSYKLLIPRRNELNLQNKNDVLFWIENNKPDFVIHAAGKVGGIQANIAEPELFLTANLELGINLLNACSELGIKNLINLGSSCMYPRNASNPLKENDILNGELEPTNEGYALAKVCIQRLCDYFSKKDKSLNYKTLIPCNIYGKFDSFEKDKSHLLPSIIAKISSAKKEKDNSVEIWGTGKVRREFMYAGDLADSIWFCLERIKNLPSCLNIGLGFDYSILEYYQAVSEVLGFDGNFTFNTKKPEGMKQKLVDISMIKKLGWESKTSLKEGIEKTCNFYSEL